MRDDLLMLLAGVKGRCHSIGATHGQAHARTPSLSLTQSRRTMPYRLRAPNRGWGLWMVEYVEGLICCACGKWYPGGWPFIVLVGNVEMSVCSIYFYMIGCCPVLNGAGDLKCQSMVAFQPTYTSRGVRSIEDVHIIHTYIGIYIHPCLVSTSIHHPCKLSNVVVDNPQPYQGERHREERARRARRARGPERALGSLSNLSSWNERPTTVQPGKGEESGQ
jgi:hypothetical protein